jgi:hypothetical protein
MREVRSSLVGTDFTGNPEWGVARNLYQSFRVAKPCGKKGTWPPAVTPFQPAFRSS